MPLIDFATRPGAIPGLIVVTMKQVTDDRGTVRELFRRSAFDSADIPFGRIEQVNLTESDERGAVRGMHAESMTKLVTVAHGRAFGIYVDARPDSPTFGKVDEVDLVPGLQVLVPLGVANGFQALSERAVYAYLVDGHWAPDTIYPAVAWDDPDLAVAWPITDERLALSARDRANPTLRAHWGGA